MFRRFGPADNTLEDISRVESLVRGQYQIDESDLILVSQDPGIKPGFPPIETNVIFFKNETRYRLKIFSPVAQVTRTDLPIGWLLPSLEDTGDGECC